MVFMYLTVQIENIWILVEGYMWYQRGPDYKTDTPLDVHVGPGFSDIQNIDAFPSEMFTEG